MQVYSLCTSFIINEIPVLRQVHLQETCMPALRIKAGVKVAEIMYFDSEEESVIIYMILSTEPEREEITNRYRLYDTHFEAGTVAFPER